MRAAAWPLVRTGRVSQVVRVSAARVAAGCVFQQEIDGALMQLLSEATAPEIPLLLIQDLDACVTGSPVSVSLLCESLDRGLAFIATVASTTLLHRLTTHGAVARRLVAVRVEEAPRQAAAAVLETFAKKSPIPVAPAAIQVALNMADQVIGAQPAASLGLLAAGIARAAWKGDAACVTPDDVLDTPPSQWPEEEQ
jgi:hypothetical protein